MRYLEVSHSKQCNAKTILPMQMNKQGKHYSRHLHQPSSIDPTHTYTLGSISIVRNCLLRIGEILSVLEFAPTLSEYANRFLGMNNTRLAYFLAGKSIYVSKNSIVNLRRNMDIAHNACADEVARSTDKNELWTAQSRYNLIQTAYTYLDEIDEKLSWRKF